ncbi:RecQ family ATP-dependent DNA helicase [Salisaeta longa]|uniref:RecQ family ATP-dependent DNA helicase n=1 Tax=Salisaeta longa TaxID=503170 RepID=UPI0003B77E5A|nr:RecQ family ATP-dependent DNA helicase [Salisaeta longa]
MDLKNQCLKYLRQALDDPSATFRDGQWEAIRDIVSKQKTLLLVRRTGWGKSMVYFLATRLLRDRGAGPTLLISPLLSLMRNQIEAAARIGINAETINSSNQDEWDRVERDTRHGDVDVLLISPERLANDQFRARVLNRVADRVGLFVVDEAHCISDWGHDFRPDYQRITRILQAMPGNVPVLGTTATANDRVVQDVVEQIGPGVEVSRGPLARASLRLQNVKMRSPTDRMAWLAKHVPDIPGSGIVYTLTVRDARRVAEWLQSQGIEAYPYSGRHDNQERAKLEQALLDNDVKALVATVALGMGFDKPDLGFVIHYQRPGSVVHYYQQVGRAGRDGNTAYGILLHGSEDDDIIDYFIRSSFPAEAHVDEVLTALEESENGLKVRDIEKRINLRKGDIRQVLKLLSVQDRSPVVKEGSRWVRTPVQYEPNREKVEAIKQIRREEQREMQRYMQHDGCLMAFLQNALDDPHAGPCGICASCTGGPLLLETVPESVAIEAAQFLRRSEVSIEPRKKWPYTDSLDAYGWENSGPYGTMEHHLRMEEGRALSIWGDAGWGQLVKQGKYRDGHFDDRLVEAAQDMIQGRWKPDPAPQWVTCVPSNGRPKLVPDYARRLANALNLPFVPCVQKVKNNESQKDMENTEQQTQNLNGVFDVTPSLVRNAPVLLVDDTVDSKWTMTVVTALLREAGAGPVYPFALAQTTPTST